MKDNLTTRDIRLNASNELSEEESSGVVTSSEYVQSTGMLQGFDFH